MIQRDRRSTETQAQPRPQTSSQVFPKIKTLAAFLLRGFEIDLRSLAAFRIGLGFMALANALVAISNAEAFFSDSGVYPRALLLGRDWESEGLWSLHLMSGSVYFQWALMSVQVAAALCVMAGYRTRLAIFVSWLLAISLESRTPITTNGSDAVLRMLLFWSLFLPMAARWSVENFKAKARTSQKSLLNFATVCILLQIAYIYSFSAVLKGWDLWFVQGKALMLALQLDAFTTPFGLWLRTHDVLCQWLCRGTVILEMTGPALALLPIFRPQMKIIMALVFVAFHAGIALSMDIGAFPLMMMAAWTLVLPPQFWNWLARLQWVRAIKAKLASRLPATRLEAAPEHLKSTLMPGWLARSFAIGCMLFVLVWNLRSVNFPLWEKVLPRSLNGFAFALRLDQHWSMFAPNPMLEDGWLVLTGDLSDGTQIDLMTGGNPVSWDKPALSSATYKDSRWQKYLMNLWERKYGQHRPWLGNYLAEKWNLTHGAFSQIGAWELFLMMEPTRMDGSVGEVQKISLWKCDGVPSRP